MTSEEYQASEEYYLLQVLKIVGQIPTGISLSLLESLVPQSVKGHLASIGGLSAWISKYPFLMTLDEDTLKLSLRHSEPSRSSCNQVESTSHPRKARARKRKKKDPTPAAHERDATFDHESAVTNQNSTFRNKSDYTEIGTELGWEHWGDSLARQRQEGSYPREIGAQKIMPKERQVTSMESDGNLFVCVESNRIGFESMEPYGTDFVKKDYNGTEPPAYMPPSPVFPTFPCFPAGCATQVGIPECVGQASADPSRGHTQQIPVSFAQFAPGSIRQASMLTHAPLDVSDSMSLNRPKAVECSGVVLNQPNENSSPMRWLHDRAKSAPLQDAFSCLSVHEVCNLVEEAVGDVNLITEPEDRRIALTIVTMARKSFAKRAQRALDTYSKEVTAEIRREMESTNAVARWCPGKAKQEPYSLPTPEESSSARSYHQI